jgi:hypothetical protein
MKKRRMGRGDKGKDSRKEVCEEKRSRKGAAA